MVEFQLADNSNTPTERTLARIDWGAASRSQCSLAVGAGFVAAADSASEHIISQGKVHRGDFSHGCWSHCEDYAFIAVHLDESADQTLEQISQQAYRLWLQQAQKLGFQHALRLWNFLPEINDGSGDQERYRRFCVGRERALVETGYSSADLPAASAIGNQCQGLMIFGLASKQVITQIENPRQVSAFDYPRRYGPASPSFARAVWHSYPNDSGCLYVSGTASVVGHESKHAGDSLKQTVESLDNIQELLKQAQLGCVQPLKAQLLRIYLRDNSDKQMVDAMIAQRWPNTSTQYLKGDICRQDLALEIEGVFAAN